MSQLPYVKITFALMLLGATGVAISQFRITDCADAAPALTPLNESESCPLVQIVNVEAAVPPAVDHFVNLATALSAEPIKSRCEQTFRIRPFAGTVFDDPSCQIYQEYEPSIFSPPPIAIPASDPCMSCGSDFMLPL